LSDVEKCLAELRMRLGDVELYIVHLLNRGNCSVDSVVKDALKRKASLEAEIGRLTDKKDGGEV
jgi:hypothetical protein